MTAHRANPSRRRLRRAPLRVQLTVLYAGLFAVLVTAILAVSGLLDRQGTTSRAGVVSSGNGIFGQHFDAGPLIVAVIAGIVAVGLAWWIAGRFLRPLRSMNAAAREISATDLHRRLGLKGPADELTELGQTLDDLFGRLEASFEAQRHFVANAAHELRTPLAGLQTLLEVTLADPHPDNDALRAACHKALAIGQHQERLVNALLALATSERGIEAWEPFDLAQITQTVLTGRQHEADNQDIQITTNLTTAAAIGDPELVKLLIANLIENAVHHNHPGGKIEITTTANDGQALFAISNTGARIPPDQIARLLQPFQRLGKERIGTKNGHGLGLAIVAAIAGAHSARLSPRPLPDGGLSIEVSFPSRRPSPSSTSSPSEQRRADIAQQPDPGSDKGWGR